MCWVGVGDDDNSNVGDGVGEVRVTCRVLSVTVVANYNSFFSCAAYFSHDKILDDETRHGGTIIFCFLEGGEEIVHILACGWFAQSVRGSSPTYCRVLLDVIVDVTAIE